MKIYLCEYLFVPFTDLRDFWDRLLKVPISSVRGLVTIQAKDKLEAEDKFKDYFKVRHPGRELKAFQINDSI